MDVEHGGLLQESIYPSDPLIISSDRYGGKSCGILSGALTSGILEDITVPVRTILLLRSWILGLL